ncbi:Protein kinase dsk1 [Verticillium dahliae VDG1]|nr:Protein kinase dsk1 [Verticillium dahliae VDG1]
MEVCSVFDLTTTALSLSWKVYQFFRAVQDAPAEVGAYLEALEATRTTLHDVQEYAAAHEQSSFARADGLQLRTLTAVLKDCELAFGLQLSSMESYRTGDVTSRFVRLRKGAAFVFGRESMAKNTAKLLIWRDLLAHAMTTSIGRNTILLRDQLQPMGADIQDMSQRLRDDEKERQKLFQTFGQYQRALGSGIAMLLDCARSAGIRNTTRVEDLGMHFAEDPFLSEEQQPSSSGGSEAPTDGSTDGLVIRPRGSVSEPDTPQDVQANGESPSAEASYTQAHAIEAAFRAVAQTASPKQVEILDAIRNPETALKILNDKQPSTSAAKSRPVLSVFSKSLAPLAKSGSDVAATAMGSMDFMLSMSMNIYGEVDATLSEVADAADLCRRELALNPGETLFRLTSQVYSVMFSMSIMCYEFVLSRATAKLAMLHTFRPKLDVKLAELRRACDRVTREVDFRHRVEMRRAGRTVAALHVEQQKMARVLRDQRAILESLRQERAMMEAAREQQRILELVQQIQFQMQAERAERLMSSATGSCEVTT